MTDIYLGDGDDPIPVDKIWLVTCSGGPTVHNPVTFVKGIEYRGVYRRSECPVCTGLEVLPDAN